MLERMYVDIKVVAGLGHYLHRTHEHLALVRDPPK